MQWALVRAGRSRWSRGVSTADISSAARPRLTAPEGSASTRAETPSRSPVRRAESSRKLARFTSGAKRPREAVMSSTADGSL